MVVELGSWKMIVEAGVEGDVAQVFFVAVVLQNLESHHRIVVQHLIV